MILLDGHSLTQEKWIGDINENLIIKERDCTAAWTPQTLEGIEQDSWFLDETTPGEGIVWRIQNIRQIFSTNTPTVNLEHVINTLKDKIIFGEVGPEQITGTVGATTCTARQAIQYILSYQSDWTLGDFDYDSVSNPYKFDGETLLEALEKVSETLDDAWWSMDTSVYPFELSITEKTNKIGSELRASRNLISIEKTIEKGGMYTRFYPVGKDDLQITGYFVERNTDIYGVKEKEETDQSLTTEAELIAWANERLNKHAEPIVTIVVDGLELSNATGEALDRIRLGMFCQIPLPEYETTITERIVEKNYPDAKNSPEVVKFTMANKREDVTKILADEIRKGGKSRRIAAKQGKEDHAWIEDTKDHVRLIAEGIAGEGAAEDWSRVAELLVDGNGIHQRVTEAQGDIVAAYSLIDQTTTAIRLEIGTVASEVRSFIQQTPDMIHAEVGYAVSGFAHSVIEQTATYIRMEVSNAASAISQSVIEQTTEYVRTEVESVASGIAYSVVIQTMTNIEQKIARKSRVYMQLTDPNDGINELLDGDIWIKADVNKTWNDNNTFTWNSQASKKWREKYGDLYYVWKNGRWIPSVDTSRDVENQVLIEQTDKLYAINAKATNLEGEQFRSRLEVTAREIRSDVSAAKSQLYSVISQTATNIRAQVENVTDGLQSQIEQTAESIATSVSAAKSALYSTILQTATNIRMDVKNVTDGLQSSIEQTAESITTSVSAAKSTLYSVIQQTATGIYTNVTDYVSGNYSTILQTSTSIAMAVKSAKDDLQSSINVEKNRISLLVEGTGANAKIKPAEIVAAINNGSSTVKISANHIQLDGDTIVGLLEGKQIGANSFMGEVLQVVRGGQLILGADSTIGNADSSDLIVGAEVNGNVLTLTRYDGSTVNFSKATTLAAGWSGGIYTVTASPQGNSRETGLKSVANADISWSGNVASFMVYAYNDGSETPVSTGKTLSVDATARYNAGYNAGKADLTITDYRVFTHNAQSTPSGYTRASNGYYIRGSGSSAEVRIYTGCDVTINGQTLYSTATPTDDYLGTMPTNVYRDGYSSGYDIGVAYGYDANHGMFIGDASYTAMPGEVNINPGSPVEVWPYFMTYDGKSYQYGPKYTFKAINPHPTSYPLYCRSHTQDQSGHHYVFAVDSGQSSWGFNEGTTYNFYR